MDFVECCEFCENCYQELTSHGNGMYSEKYICTIYSKQDENTTSVTAKEVKKNDWCKDFVLRKSIKGEFGEIPTDVFDSVSRPSHYAKGRKYEPKDVIRDWGLNFNLGNTVKYVARAGRKDDILQDLKKARQYLDFEIEYLEANK